MTKRQRAGGLWIGREEGIAAFSFCFGSFEIAGRDQTASPASTSWGGGGEGVMMGGYV